MGAATLMFESHHIPILIAAGIAFCLIAGAFLALKIAKFIESVKWRRLRNRGERGEDTARKYLMKHGYRILEEQPRRTAVLLLDGEPTNYEVRADFLVERKNRRAVVEVKTGKTATDPASRHTRRQLLEYFRVYEAEDLLFFNAESKKIMSISFPENDNPTSNTGTLIRTFAWGALVGAGAAILVFTLMNK
jgi:Holliday junction resolvase-like predicted endonuclease